jgi:hypothetical protein
VLNRSTRTRFMRTRFKQHASQLLEFDLRSWKQINLFDQQMPVNKFSMTMIEHKAKRR